MPTAGEISCGPKRVHHLFVAYEKVFGVRKQAGRPHRELCIWVSFATKSCGGIEFCMLRLESRYPFFFFTILRDSVMVNHVPLNTRLAYVLLDRAFLFITTYKIWA